MLLARPAETAAGERLQNSIVFRSLEVRQVCPLSLGRDLSTIFDAQMLRQQLPEPIGVILN